MQQSLVEPCCIYVKIYYSRAPNISKITPSKQHVIFASLSPALIMITHLYAQSHMGFIAYVFLINSLLEFYGVSFFFFLAQNQLRVCNYVSRLKIMFVFCCPLNLGQRDLGGNVRHGAWLKIPGDYLQDIYGQEDRVCSCSYSAFPRLEATAEPALQKGQELQAGFVLRLCRLRNTQAVQDLHV